MKKEKNRTVKNSDMEEHINYELVMLQSSYYQFTHMPNYDDANWHIFINNMWLENISIHSYNLLKYKDLSYNERIQNFMTKVENQIISLSEARTSVQNENSCFI